MRVVAATRRLGEEAEDVKSPPTKPEEFEQKKVQRFRISKGELEKRVDELIQDCSTLEERWVAHQRVFHIKSLGKRAGRLRNEIEKATLENWREIQIPFR